MRIIAVGNQKGGCGKTTTSINLSASLAQKGKTVLLIDCDPQAHATLGLKTNPSNLDQNLYHVLTTKDDIPPKALEDIIISINKNFYLAPSGVILGAFEQEFTGKDGREDRLKEVISALKRPYDYVIIDCPPSISLLSINALRACREVIIPIDLSLFSLRGVAKLIEIILLLKEKRDHEVRPRALITMYDFRTRYAKRVLDKVKEKFGQNLFNSVIRYNIRLREAVDNGLPIGEYDKHAIGFKDFDTLADEVIASEADESFRWHDALMIAKEILLNTEEYIDMAGENSAADAESQVEANRVELRTYS